MTPSTSTDEQLRQLFGASTCLAGRQLLASGAVRDVRTLQDGRVITGIVTEQARAHRVYIRRPQRLGFEGLEAECSCGEHALCAHVAAVSLAATAVAHASTEYRPAAITAPGHAPHTGTTQQQCLLYVFEEGTGGAAADGIQVALWIRQPRTQDALIDAHALVRFELRATAEPGAFPRYVDARDRAIIAALAALRSSAPWTLQGEAGASVLQQSTATGRAFWKSPQGAPLQRGATRHVPFRWEVMPNGAQRLRGQAPRSVHLAANLEPAVYVDADANVWGALQTSAPIHLLRAYANLPPVPPERVAEINARIVAEAGAAFPRLRELTLRHQPLASLAPQLVLSRGPTAALHFIYNGLDIDACSLGSGDTVRRFSAAGDHEVCWEMPRDHASEHRLRAQLDAHRPDRDQSADAWLAFMMNAVPALQAQGWSLRIEDDFPYRIAQPDAWYADVSSAHRDGWFDLSLGVSVNGKPVNLLPALVSYLQAALSPADASYRRIGEHLLIRLEDGCHVPVPLARIERISHTLVELHEARSLNRHEALSLPVGQAHRIAQLAIELDTPHVRSADDALRPLLDELASA